MSQVLGRAHQFADGPVVRLAPRFTETGWRHLSHVAVVEKQSAAGVKRRVLNRHISGAIPIERLTVVVNEVLPTQIDELVSGCRPIAVVESWVRALAGVEN